MLRLLGLPCEMDRISERAKEKGLIVLEDAAHAHGASMQGKKMGFSRDSLVKALKAEGVDVNFCDYPEQHKLKIYSEAKWWHHAPQVPASMPGNAYINANHIFLPLLYKEAPELIGQYVSAFEKIWAHRAELAKA
jgi:dTDP-4-amino-4,6-dideoxygalactose transaminase